MCKHVELTPLDSTNNAMKKTCKPAMLSRIWHASRRSLNLEHSTPHLFACSQWQSGTMPSTSYLIYRWLLFLTLISIGISSFACQRLPPMYDGPPIEINYFKWFIYFTNWGYILMVLQAGLALAVVHRFRKLKTFNITCDEEEIAAPRRKRTPLLCRMYWVCHTIATDLAFVITLIYWTLVHDPKIHELNSLNLLVHGANSLVMLVELAVTAHPLRAAHALFSASAGVAYGLFSALYWALGGTDRIGLPAIYSTLDWNKPGSALGFVGLCAIVMMLAHGVATVLALARTKVAARFAENSANTEKLTLSTH